MRLLTIEQVVLLHQRLLQQSGGGQGIRDMGILESAIAQPNMSYESELLYPTLIDKVAALGFSLINNHPFIDGNKRIGHAAIEVTLLMNGFEITVNVDEQESIILSIASGKMDRMELNQWLQQYVSRR
ncbi:MAG: type II toxin-antitoxin system death-on-curing family toxin [Methyloprofundus sp.]|nr:type II toxin-antitoxin system death-on-curing family toxin [Methyloprofundus sp.]